MALIFHSRREVLRSRATSSQLVRLSVAQRRTVFSQRLCTLDKGIPLFQELLEHGWHPNSPRFYGEVLLSRVVNNLPLLRWFLAHGANPNRGPYRPGSPAPALRMGRRTGEPDTNSYAALETAAYFNNIEAVRMLLDAGAKIGNGAPLQSVARPCPPGTNPDAGLVRPTKEFDESRIPLMALLVERGADVKHYKGTAYLEARYAIVAAVRAGAVERVNWLLEHGANPEVGLGKFNAVIYASYFRTEEMKQVLEEGIRARRWVKDDPISSDDDKKIPETDQKVAKGSHRSNFPLMKPFDVVCSRSRVF